jgi:cystathionine beta-lyase family protein involved in aluminum resistance
MDMPFFKIDKRLIEVSERAQQSAEKAFETIEKTTEYNQQKVLAAFIENRVSESHFVKTTGYGYGDRGRDVLDSVFAMSMGTEDALVRHSIVSGTHAITIALFGILRPGDILLAVTGSPYDTLEQVIGLDDSRGQHSDIGSLRDYGILYEQVELDESGRPNLGLIADRVEQVKPKAVHIQRSRGYSVRPSLTVADIEKIVQAVRRKSPETIVFVDNCYGEFVERQEPTQVGADLMAGSLIKNPGGGIAENGGYICGRADLVEQCAYRMTTPGLGREVGASLGHNRSLYMGLFNAPHVVGEALKTAVYCAWLFSMLGYEVTPAPDEIRTDIIQAVKLGSPEAMVAFCQGIQRGAPVDSFVVPEPWDMPGYENQVIMAAGAFTMGASIELSADAPLREPYAAYMQGGLNYHSGKIGVLMAAQSMLEKGLLNI